MANKNIPQTRKKTKVTSSYMKSVSVVSNSLGLILVGIAIQWHSAEFCIDTKKLRKVTMNVEKHF